jgi:tetratricopeptide (TPR) repeat protein
MSARDRIRRLCKEEKWAEAVMEARRVEPDSEIAWSHGWALYKLGRFNDALSPLHDSLALTTDQKQQAVTHWAIGVVLREMGEVGQAEASFREALRIRDGYLPRLSLATLLLEQGRVQEGESVHLEGIRLKPDSRKRLEAYADFLSDIGREAEAQEMLAKAEHLPSDS